MRLSGRLGQREGKHQGVQLKPAAERTLDRLKKALPGHSGGRGGPDLLADGRAGLDVRGWARMLSVSPWEPESEPVLSAWGLWGGVGHRKGGK